MTGIKIDINASQVADLAAAWSQAPDIMGEELVRGVLEGSLYLERLAKGNAPTATGAYRSSIAAGEPQRMADSVIGTVGTSIGYAVPVELGTKPHMPPVQALADWAQVKFGLPAEEAERVGFAIARSIARKGTKAQYVFTRAFTDGEATVQRIITAAAQRGLDRLAQAGVS